MKPKDIKELIDFIANSGLNEVNIETDEFKIHVKKGAEGQSTSTVAATPQPVAAALPEPTPSPAQESSTATPEKADDSDRYLMIKSPMIGTFYRSPNPESDPFINVGDTIKQGTVVGIIEAMKLFNEIESEVAGKLVKVLVDDASPVEYDQPLFLIDPS